tara:strand:+ start:250 stop:366 length:117 start_codon:yes stop_codon:yes gene_type:complete
MPLISGYNGKTTRKTNPKEILEGTKKKTNPKKILKGIL